MPSCWVLLLTCNMAVLRKKDHAQVCFADRVKGFISRS